MRKMTAIAIAVALSGAAVAATAAGAGAAVKVKPVATGLNGPSGFTFAPNGTIWYLERGTGKVRTLDPKTGATHLVFTIGGVDGSGERGALGIALHPRWPAKKLVYVYATRMSGGHLRNQLVRFRVRGGSGSGLLVLLGAPASASPYHNGGRVRSYGHRNSFGFAFDPETHRLWETENGPECTDEINLIVKGANFGWGPKESCSLPKPAGTNNSGPKPRHRPRWFFPSTIGITGAAFCDRCGIGALNGKLVFGDVNTGSIRSIALNARRSRFSSKPHIVATAPSGVHSMEVSSSGQLFVSTPAGIYRLAAA